VTPVAPLSQQVPVILYFRCCVLWNWQHYAFLMLISCWILICLVTHLLNLYFFCWGGVMTYGQLSVLSFYTDYQNLLVINMGTSIIECQSFPNSYGLVSGHFIMWLVTLLKYQESSIFIFQIICGQVSKTPNDWSFNIGRASAMLWVCFVLWMFLAILILCCRKPVF
jgi:hypothetical protein